MRRVRARGWPIGRSMRLAGVAFVAAIAVSTPMQTVVVRLPAPLAVAVLLVVVLLSIASDAVGVASTAAKEHPIHARAAKKRRGARMALQLLRHCDQVATFASDTVGDIAGTVSGAVAATLLVNHLGTHVAFAVPLAIGVLAGVTIFLKALGKYMAVKEADAIVMLAGTVLEGVEKALPIRFFGGSRLR